MSTREWLEGQLARVLWHSAETGYAVVRVRTAQGEVTAVGELALLAGEVEEGSFLAVEGRWESHAVHGRQFRADGFLHATPRTLEGMELYLAKAGIPGVGKATARAIVKKFGVELPGVLENDPDRLTEVSGVGRVKARAIVQRWGEDEQSRALDVRLRGLGLNGRQIQRIKNRYGDTSAHVVATKPYRLCEEIAGIGFRTADHLARQQGLDPSDPARVRAALLYALDRASNDGHCYLPRARAQREVRALDVPIDAFDDVAERAEVDGGLVVEGANAVERQDQTPRSDDRLWRTAVFRDEEAVAETLSHRRRGARLPPSDTLHDEVLAAERFVGVTLHERQREAVEAGLRGGTVVVTGGPGTGKTTLLKVLLRAVHERGDSWLLASPTGRASRRMEEATGVPASTVHRLLEYRPGEGGFQRGPDKPLEGQGLVIDEASMVDLVLMRALLDALPDPADRRMALVLVGDADQLPSVGAGCVLRDIIDSGVVPVVRLDRVFRQGAESGILDAAAAIHRGRVPISGERGGFDDIFLIERDQSDRAVSTLITVVSERMGPRGFDPLRDVQVLTPTRKGPLGTESLNKALQAALNADGAPVKRGGREFRLGDRVICTRNRYDVEVFNGDVGRVRTTVADGLLIRFDGRDVIWEWAEFGSLELAYAITIHKSQGSEYPAVVVVLHHSHGIMLRRNLFYTAVTRAKGFLCVIGSRRGWERAVQERGGDERFTGLAGRLEGFFSSPEI